MLSLRQPKRLALPQPLHARWKCAILITITLAAVVKNTSCSSYPSLQDKVPNGNHVPHPYQQNVTWPEVGRQTGLPGDDAPLNDFGRDFFSVGGGKWSWELCNLDSDGDGLSNGFELGDPNCTWKEGETANTSPAISHPGVCEPVGSERCTSNTSLLDCAGRLRRDDTDSHGSSSSHSRETQFSCDTIHRPEVKTHDVRFPRTVLPDSKTSYFCLAADLPEDGDLFAIAGEPIIDNPEVVHHMKIYGCTEKEIYRGFYDTGKPRRCEATCDNLLLLWTVGMPGQCYPKNVGMGFGRPSGLTKLLLQIHWNNPSRKENIADSSGIRLYYEQSRTELVAAAVATIVQFSLFIPPHTASTLQTGSCISNCTSQWLNSPIHVFDVLHHMHLLGSSQVTYITKEGGDQEQQVEVVRDSEFRYDRPVVHRLAEPLRVAPGDTIQTICEYNSLDKAEWTFKGAGTSDEMCESIIMYYPQGAANGRFCGSLGTSHQCRNAEDRVVKFCEPSMVNELLSFKNNQSLAILNEVRRSCHTDDDAAGCRPRCKSIVQHLNRDPCVGAKLRQVAGKGGDDNPEMLEFVRRLKTCETFLDLVHIVV